MVFEGWKPAPLSSSFMLTAILGFIISAFWVLPQNEDWGVTFMIIFSLMFIASMISMTHAPIRDLEVLDQRERRAHTKKRNVKRKSKTTRRTARRESRTKLKTKSVRKNTNRTGQKTSRRKARKKARPQSRKRRR